MMSPAEIIHEAECLPVEARAQVVDSLLRSLYQPNTEINWQWAEDACYCREYLANRSWVERNAQALLEHGRNISATGLAGEEFDRI